jgi:hypothetical protein
MLRLRRLVALAQTFGRIVLLFVILRLVAGVIIIAFFDRDAVAWGYEVTAILAGVIVVCLLAALAVRRYAPPRRA